MQSLTRLDSRNGPLPELRLPVRSRSPPDKKILLDISVTLTSLTINSGAELRFDLFTPVTLTTGSIMNNGVFRIGSLQCYYNSKATVTLTGTDLTGSTVGVGNKFFLTDSGGAIYLYGAHGPKAWTYLNQIAKPLDTSVVVEDVTGWAVGDQIVIASTDFDYTQAEMATITAINGNSVSLGYIRSASTSNVDVLVNYTSLKYLHWGTRDPYIDERAEVAHLTRKIVIQGDTAGEAMSPQYGGHFLMQSGFTNAHVEGVEFVRMGQQSILGKYPMHWHMLGKTASIGKTANCIFNTVHSSFQRCFVAHAVSDMTARDNVCFRARGHNFFFEDGAEKNNTITRNLAISVRDLNLIPTDSDPAGFWITNPDNTFTNNRVAGTPAHCFWFSLPANPIGPSADPNYFNRYQKLGVFRGNTAHSCGTDGLHVDSGPNNAGVVDGGSYSPTIDNKPPAGSPCTAGCAGFFANFESFTAYKCRNRGVWFRGGHLMLTDCTLADNKIGLTMAVGGAYSNTTVNTCLIIGETQNYGQPASWELKGRYGRSLPNYSPFPIRGVEFYDGPNTLRNITFKNFKPDEVRQAGAIAVLYEDQFSLESSNNLRSAKFDSSVTYPVYNPNVFNDGDKNFAFIDWSGVVAGTPGVPAYVTQDLDFYTTSLCTRKPTWNARICPKTSHNFVRLRISNYQGSSCVTRFAANGDALMGATATRDLYQAGFTVYPQQRIWGFDPVSTSYRDTYDFTLLASQRYVIDFSHKTPTDMRLWLGWLLTGKGITIGIRYPPGTTFTGGTTVMERQWWSGNSWTAGTSLADIEASSGTKYWFDSSRSILWVYLYQSATIDPYDIDSNDLTVRIKPTMGTQNLASCPVGLPSYLPPYLNDPGCTNSEDTITRHCPAKPYCSGHGYCNSGGSCVCDPGFIGAACDQPSCSTLYSTCNGKGTCNTGTGVCTCNTGFYGVDCSFTSSCPGGCGQGTCVASQCVCNAGYEGATCDTRVWVASMEANWKYFEPTSATASPPAYPLTVTFRTTLDFIQATYDDSTWKTGSAPFYITRTDAPSTVYDQVVSQSLGTTLADNCNAWNCDANYYFRKKFTITSTELSAIRECAVYMASQNGANVYINGQLLSEDALSNHQPLYYNLIVQIPISNLIAGTNTIAVFLKNDNWDSHAWFDMKLITRNVDSCATAGCNSVTEDCIVGQCRCKTNYIPNSDGVCQIIPGPCTPSCAGKTCGSDGCSGSCGNCSVGNTCSSGTCVCARNCAGKTCGSDGCGGSCGTCSGSTTCSNGNCVCAPNCAGKTCGSDGCGGSCGTCSGSTTCSAGACVCAPNCAGKTCGSDGCGGSCGSCGSGTTCSSGACVCAPNCAGKNCGSDGCSGSCGSCNSSTTCSSGACVCAPNCAGKTCGSNGCGGSCGTCSIGTTCTSGACICAPNCTGKVCGDDGCGGSCGPCGTSQFCSAGACVSSCTPSCAGKNCGDDGCGGSCGTCGTGTTCTAGACVCAPNCTAKACGDDGCSGSCGTCGTGLTCSSFVCGCAGSCAGKQCGDDGCGTSCGSCTGISYCNNSQCVASVGLCVGKNCGPDGSGGSCGNCSMGLTCNAGGLCVCAPDCTGKSCGDDGCGGSCGSCGSTSTCYANGTCSTGCQPACTGLSCGSDSCGGSCGTCTTGYQCNTIGHCVLACSPDCTGRSCGPDPVCNTNCGDCTTANTSCVSGSCQLVVADPCRGVDCSADINSACKNGVCECKQDFIRLPGDTICQSIFQLPCSGVICDNDKYCTGGVCVCRDGTFNASGACNLCVDGTAVACNVYDSTKSKIIGSGYTNCTGGVYPECTPTSCDPYNYELFNGKCIEKFCSPGQSRVCDVTNGAGVENCVDVCLVNQSLCSNKASGTGIFLTCAASTCNSGYVASGSSCIPASASPSSSATNSGSSQNSGVASSSNNNGGKSSFMNSPGFYAVVAVAAALGLALIITAIVLIIKKKSGSTRFGSSWY